MVKKSFKPFQSPWNDLGLFGSCDLAQDGIGHFDEFQKRPRLFGKYGSIGVAERLSALDAILEDADSRADFAAFALAGDDAEYLPHILLSLEELLSFTFADDTSYEAPSCQLPEIRVGVAPADLKIRHDVVRAEWSGADHEQRVDLCHRAVDTPRAPQRTPLGDELIASHEVGRLVSAGVRRFRAHSVVSVLSESSFVARDIFRPLLRLQFFKAVEASDGAFQNGRYKPARMAGRILAVSPLVIHKHGPLACPSNIELYFFR